MLPNRLYKANKSEILYHYCSAETFMAICTTRKLRLSDLFAMNDFMEFHWGYQIWERAAGELLQLIGKEFLDAIDELICVASEKALTLASCLSRRGDVLSQWRAYADDGQGFAIGFNAYQIAGLQVTPLLVEYSEAVQIEEVKRFVLDLYETEKHAKESRSDEFVTKCMQMAFGLTSFKNPAFSEEDEVRLIHLLGITESNSSFRLVDKAGYAFGKEIGPQKLEFHLGRNTPVPHLDLSFDGEFACPISEVIIGPRNNSLPSGVSIFLETIGIPNVKVKKSLASYR